MKTSRRPWISILLTLALATPIAHLTSFAADAPAPNALAPGDVKIMPLGDSITQGNTHQDSYRRDLWHLLHDAGYHFQFVGSEKTNFTGHAPHPDFQEDNEGHYGWKITDVLPKLDGWLNQNDPDIVLLHLGTNDAQISDPPTIEANLTKLIAILRAHNPHVKIVLAQLMTPWGAIAKVNQDIPALAGTLTTADSPIVVVNQAAGFDTQAGHDTVDGCHPNTRGEAKIAHKWFGALRPLLPTPTISTTRPASTN